MPHQCVHCSKIYDDGSEEILKGCSSCGSRFFFYITKERLEKIVKNRESENNESEKEDSNEVIELSKGEKKQIEKDVREIVGEEDNDVPIVLDFESIKILKPGKYLIDLHNLFKKERPLIYKLEDGKYMIDFASFKPKNKFD